MAIINGKSTYANVTQPKKVGEQAPVVPTATPSSNRQVTTFADIVSGAGGQKLQSQDPQTGQTVDNYRFQAFDYGKDRYSFDKSGNIVKIGSSTADTGNKVIGIESTGREFNIGSTSEVYSTSGLGKLSTEQKQSLLSAPGGLLESVAAGGRLQGLRAESPVALDELSKMYGAPSGTPTDGSLSGAEKLAKYREAGLMDYGLRGGGGIFSGPVKSTADLTNIDFAEELGIYKNPPRKGETEDPKDYELRKAKWEKEQVTTAYNSVMQDLEKKKLKESIDNVTGIQRKPDQVKTADQIANDLKNDDGFNSQFNVAKQQYKSKRKAEAIANAEKRGKFVTGSSATVKAIREAILKEEKEKAQQDIKEFNSIADTKRSDMINTISKESARKGLEFAQLSDEDIRKKRMEKDQKEREDKYIAQGFTPLQAKAKVDADIKAFAGSKEKLAEFDQFQDLISTGDVNKDYSNAGSVIFNKITKNKGDIKKILENTPGFTPEMVNDQMFAIDKAQNPSLTREKWDSYSVKTAEIDDQSGFLSGTLSPDKIRVFMDNIEVNSPEKAERVYKTALRNGSYSDDPIMSDLLQLRLDRLKGPAAGQSRAMDALITEWEYATPTRKSEIQAELESQGKFTEFMDKKLAYKSDEFDYANLALQNVPIQLRNSEGEREFFLSGIKGFREKGFSPYEAADRVLGFIVNNKEDKAFADYLRRRYNASGNASQDGLKDIARAINEGDPLTAISQVENTLISPDAEFGQASVESIFKTTQEIKELIDKVGPEFMGALDKSFFKLGQFTATSELLSRVDKGQRKDAVRLGGLLARVMAADRKAFGGGDLSEKEIEVLADAMADLTDQPFAAKSKIQLLEDQALRKYNALRRTVRLPEYVSPSEVIFDDLKLGIYQDEASRQMPKAVFTPETNNSVDIQTVPTSRDEVINILKSNGFSNPSESQINETIRLNGLNFSAPQSETSARPQSTVQTETRPIRNNNPINVKIGGVADQYAKKDENGKPMVDDQNHLIFENAEQGKKAAEAELRAKVEGRSLAAQRKLGKQVETLADLGSIFAEDPNWTNGVASILGVDINESVKNIDFDKLLTAVARQEGGSRLLAMK